MPSLLITEAEFQTLPEDCRKVLLARFAPDAEMAFDETGQPAPTAADLDEEPSDFSPAQAQKACESFSSKTKDVIRQIITYPVDGFELSDLEKKLNVQPGGLKGSWSGITKVTHRVLGDDEAQLIWWTETEDGSWHGRLSQMTHRSFRRALGLN